METEKVDKCDGALDYDRLMRKWWTSVRRDPEFRAVRYLSASEWVERYASGTLRKSVQLGLRWRELYLEERTCFEFGWEFRAYPTSRVTFNDLMAEGDCPAVTETLWHAGRLVARNPYPADEYEVKYVHVTLEDEQREGAAILVRRTDAPWLPKGRLVLAIVAEYRDGRWREPVNPC